MKKYGVCHKTNGAHVAGPYDDLSTAVDVAKALDIRGDQLTTVTWVGFGGVPTVNAIMRRIGDDERLETLCLYRAEADRICREMGGDEAGVFVRPILLNASYPRG
jgi:hypothetical protein